ncbi:MAG: SDR family oxidoreductase [Actinomycetota bacterium]|nr:SDR family oxidoreductase [Actinomycetota bacterium]
MEIEGRRVLLTGATGGLGSAIAMDLSQRGAELVLSGRRTSELESLAALTGGSVLTADLATADGLEALCDAASDVDIVVANAGIGSDVSIEAMGAGDIDVVIDVNLRGPIHLATRFAQSRIERYLPGSIVFVGSLSGLAASPNTRMYNATKFGLRGFALSLREDLAPYGIGVGIVEPGFIREAGMFANSGTQLPTGVRTKTAPDVARGVAEAILEDRAEVFVAPIELRLAATLASVAPGLSAWVQRRAGAAEITASRN